MFQKSKEFEQWSCNQPLDIQECINSASGAAGHEYPQPALLCSLQSHQHVFVDSMKEHQLLSHFYNTNVSAYFIFIPCKEMVLWRSKSLRLPQICLKGEMAAQLNGGKKRITFNYLPKKKQEVLLRSHSDQDFGQVSQQDLHLGVTKSQLQRDEELGCVAVNSQAGFWGLQQELGMFQPQKQLQKHAWNCRGTQRACAHPLEWQPPRSWATEWGTTGRIWPMLKKDEVAQAQLCCSLQKNHTKKATKRGKSQFEMHQAQVRATCTQNLQAHLFITNTELRDK